LSRVSSPVFDKTSKDPARLDASWVATVFGHVAAAFSTKELREQDCDKLKVLRQVFTKHLGQGRRWRDYLGCLLKALYEPTDRAPRHEFSVSLPTTRKDIGLVLSLLSEEQAAKSGGRQRHWTPKTILTGIGLVLEARRQRAFSQTSGTGNDPTFYATEDDLVTLMGMKEGTGLTTTLKKTWIVDAGGSGSGRLVRVVNPGGWLRGARILQPLPVLMQHLQKHPSPKSGVIEIGATGGFSAIRALAERGVTVKVPG